MGPGHFRLFFFYCPFPCPFPLSIFLAEVGEKGKPHQDGMVAKVRARFQEKKEGASSVVAAVLGEASFYRLCRYGIRLLGARHDVDAYEEVRPNAFCSRCSGWGHIAPHCTATDSKCSICSGDHEATNHRCPVEGCKVGRSRPCPHGVVKCANCGGTNHGHPRRRGG